MHVAFLLAALLESAHGSAGNGAAREEIRLAGAKGDEKLVPAWLDGGGQGRDVVGNVSGMPGREWAREEVLLSAAHVQSDSITALMAAANKGDERVVDLLLRHGAEANLQNSNGDSTLMHAAIRGHEKVVEVLLWHGAEANLQNSFGSTALMAAAQEGFDQVAELLLQHGVDANPQDNKGDTALMIAAYNGNERVVEMLLEHGAEVNLQDNAIDTALTHGAKVDHQSGGSGTTALMSAARHGYGRVVAGLLRHGADINLQNSNGDTALILAALYNRPTIVIRLLRAGADARARTVTGRTALQCAREKGHTACIRMLEKFQMERAGLEKFQVTHAAGKDAGTPFDPSVLPPGEAERVWVDLEEITRALDACDEEAVLAYIDGGGQLDVVFTGSGEKRIPMRGEKGITMLPKGITMLMSAILCGHERVFSLLLQRVEDVDQTTDEGWSAMMIAAINGLDRCVDGLVMRGADVNRRDSNGSTALMYAATQGHEIVAETLLKHGASVNLPERDGATALMYCAFHGQEKVAEVLLRHGADTSHKGNKGHTALMHAVSQGHEPLIDILLRNGASIDRQGSGGINALTIAVFNNQPEILRRLMRSGTDSSAANGKQALQLAREQGCGECVTALEQSLVVPREIFAAARRGDDKLVLAWLDGGGHVDATFDMKGVSGITLLMVAAGLGHRRLVELLPARGSDANLQNSDGGTALMGAAKKGHEQVVEALLQHGAKVDQQLTSGETALMLAAYANWPAVVRRLLRAGADANARNAARQTALQMAEREGHAVCIWLLEEWHRERGRHWAVLAFGLCDVLMLLYYVVRTYLRRSVRARVRPKRSRRPRWRQWTVRERATTLLASGKRLLLSPSSHDQWWEMLAIAVFLYMSGHLPLLTALAAPVTVKVVYAASDLIAQRALRIAVVLILLASACGAAAVEVGGLGWLWLWQWLTGCLSMSLSVEMAHLNPYAHLLMNIAGFGHKRSLPWIAEGAAFSAAEDAGGAQCVAGTAQGASEDVRDAIQREEALQQGSRPPSPASSAAVADRDPPGGRQPGAAERTRGVAAETTRHVDGLLPGDLSTWAPAATDRHRVQRHASDSHETAGPRRGGAPSTTTQQLPQPEPVSSAAAPVSAGGSDAPRPSTTEAAEFEVLPDLLCPITGETTPAIESRCERRVTVPRASRRAHGGPGDQRCGADVRCATDAFALHALPVNAAASHPTQLPCRACCDRKVDCEGQAHRPEKRHDARAHAPPSECGCA